MSKSPWKSIDDELLLEVQILARTESFLGHQRVFLVRSFPCVGWCVEDAKEYLKNHNFTEWMEIPE